MELPLYLDFRADFTKKSGPRKGAHSFTGHSEDPQSRLPVVYSARLFSKEKQTGEAMLYHFLNSYLLGPYEIRVMWPREKKVPGPVSCLSSIADPSMLLLGLAPLLLLLQSGNLIGWMFCPPTGNKRGMPLFLPLSP